MQLVTVLASGVIGAANGSVDIYNRGTAVRSTYYNNYDGTGAVTPTGSIALDANGGKVLYVDQEVDVIVRDSSSNPVRSFTVMETAANVEVKSSSFNGTDYNTLAVAPGNPITLKAVLDEWFTSAGTYDFKVMQASTPTKLSDAVSGLTTLWVNVKSTTYGALGDGVHDDTTAIQAACTAAASLGGVVYFPPGAYLVTGNISVPSNVSLLGAGPALTYLSLNHATNPLFVMVGGAYGYTFVRDMLVTFAQNNTGDALRISGSVAIDNVQFGDPGFQRLKGQAISLASGASVSLRNCRFYLGSSTARGVSGNVASPGTLGTVRMFGCDVTVQVSAWNGYAVAAKNVACALCKFDFSTVSSGTFSGLYSSVTPDVETNAVVGCAFLSPASGVVTSIAINLNGPFFEAVNYFQDTGITGYFPYQIPASGTDTIKQGGHATRIGRKYYSTDTSASPLIHSDYYSEQVLYQTAATNQTISPQNGLPGDMFTFAFTNLSGGVRTLTFGSTVRGIASANVNNAQTSTFFFVCVEQNLNIEWVLIGSAQNQTP